LAAEETAIVLVLDFSEGLEAQQVMARTFARTARRSLVGVNDGDILGWVRVGFVEVIGPDVTKSSRGDRVVVPLNVAWPDDVSMDAIGRSICRYEDRRGPIELTCLPLRPTISATFRGSHRRRADC